MIIRAINDRLQSSSELQAILGEKIYPISIPQKIKAPAIAFNANDFPQRSKSGNIGDKNEVTIFTISTDYSELSEINRIVRELFDNTAWNLPYIGIAGSFVTGVSRTKNDEYNEYQGMIKINITSKIK